MGVFLKNKIMNQQTVVSYNDFTETVKPIIKKGMVMGIETVKNNLIDLVSDEMDIVLTSKEKQLVYDILDMIDIEIDNIKSDKITI